MKKIKDNLKLKSNILFTKCDIFTINLDNT